ncbi:MAG: hypothetical protein KF857_09500 [Fimbriimonadaceae bacterium]|nr:hypothetical protein [Fimbriimonadaceae bacterium]
MRTVLFANQKGGVGRTTVSGNVAAAAARAGTSTAWVTTADGDWARVENLTVFGSDPSGLRQAVNDAQAAVADGLVVVDLPACDHGAGWWTGEGDVVLVSDGDAASLYAALEAVKAWRDALKPPMGFVLNRVGADVADEVAANFRKTVAQYASVTVSRLGSVSNSAESGTLANTGRFCQGKATACYGALARRLMTVTETTATTTDAMDVLRSRRERLRAA